MLLGVLKLLGIVAVLVVAPKLAMLGLDRFGPWARLVATYGTTQPFTARRWWFRTGHIGGLRYSGTLVVGASEEGLFVMPHLLWATGSAILIPWDHVSGSPDRVGFTRVVRLDLRDAPDASLKFMVRLTRRIAAGSGGRFELPEFL